MSKLRQQASGIVDVCKTVIAGKGKDQQQLRPDNQTIEVARAILVEAKQQAPDDKVLAAVSLDAPVFWTTLLTAMEMILRTLPLGTASASSGGSAAGDKAWMG
jgi:hypothetical protein